MSELFRRQVLFSRFYAGLLSRIGLPYKLGETLRSPTQAVLNSLTPGERGRVAQLLEPEFPLLAAAVRKIVGQRPGSARSVHPDGCAGDVLLFDATGNYLTTAGPYTELGEWWKAQDPLCHWGGDFPGDPGHFSVTPDGVRK